jgi:hypothetical protein
MSAVPIAVLAVVFGVAVLGLALALIFMSGDRRGAIEQRLGDLIQQDVVEEIDDPFLSRPDQVMAETRVMQRVVGRSRRSGSSCSRCRWRSACSRSPA